MKLEFRLCTTSRSEIESDGESVTSNFQYEKSFLQNRLLIVSNSYMLNEYCSYYELQLYEYYQTYSRGNCTQFALKLSKLENNSKFEVYLNLNSLQCELF